MSERNGAKLYLQLSAYELGQLIAILPIQSYKQMDDRLRKKIQAARDHAERDSLIEDGIREIEQESAGYSTRFGGDPLSRYDSVEEEHTANDTNKVFAQGSPSFDRPVSVRILTD
jgi:hypothetical protein